MLLKTGQCFTEELALNCPTIVACVTALPTGPDAAPGDALLGPDGQFHALPAFPAQVPQALTLAGQTLTLSNGGGSVTLPDSDDQTLTLVGNALSISGGNTVTLPSAPGQVAQVLSLYNQELTLSGGGGSVTLPDNDNQALDLQGNVLSISGGNSVTLPAATIPFATPAETIAGTSTTLAVNPADLYARENIAAQTGLGLVLSAIPAPGPAQSVWGVNTLGETLHYAPGLGWQIVDKKYHQTVNTPAGVTTPAGVWGLGTPVTAPRAGQVLITSKAVGYNAATHFAMATGLFKNGVQITQSNMGTVGQTGTAASTNGYQAILQTPSIVIDVVAGDVIAYGAISTGASIDIGGFIQITYN